MTVSLEGLRARTLIVGVINLADFRNRYSKREKKVGKDKNREGRTAFQRQRETRVDFLMSNRSPKSCVRQKRKALNNRILVCRVLIQKTWIPIQL